MLIPPWGPYRQQAIRDVRVEMIRQTEAFLSLALAEDRPLPPIPRVAVRDGGVAPLLRRPGARALVHHWWRRVLNSTSLDE